MTPSTPTTPAPKLRPPKPTQDRFHLLIDCRTEQDQRRLYGQLKSQGFSCRVLVL
jgi:hypothetical protein